MSAATTAPYACAQPDSPRPSSPLASERTSSGGSRNGKGQEPSIDAGADGNLDPDADTGGVMGDQWCLRNGLSSDEAGEIAATFKALADPVRLRVLSLIARRAPAAPCVCEISGQVEVSTPTVSHHLKVLRDAGLVASERRGMRVHYRIRPANLTDLGRLLTGPTRTERGGAAQATGVRAQDDGRAARTR